MIFGSVPYESFRVDAAAKVVVKLCALRHVHQKRSQRERIPASDIKRLLNPSFGALCGRSGAAWQQSSGGTPEEKREKTFPSSRLSHFRSFEHAAASIGERLFYRRSP